MCMSADRGSHSSVNLTVVRNGRSLPDLPPDALLSPSITSAVPSELGFPDGAHNAIAPLPGIRSSAKEPANVSGDRDRPLPGNE